MKEKETSFRKEWNRILKSRPRHLVHLTCRKCGTTAHAASLEIADLVGGWTKLRKLKSSTYTGLCIECSPSRSTPKKRRKP